MEGLLGPPPGVVCGHIHHAGIREHDGVVHYNDGDWVESRTALGEHLDGRLEIVRWSEERELACTRCGQATA